MIRIPITGPNFPFQNVMPSFDAPALVSGFSRLSEMLHWKILCLSDFDIRPSIADLGSDNARSLREPESKKTWRPEFHPGILMGHLGIVN
jgi:hypothetical protein